MSIQRSKSVPVARDHNKIEAGVESETASFPTLPQEPTIDPSVPSWIQELANARSGRHSRASSIVSTRTRFSTTTFDDARSIDIQAGGQTFRISRRGDRVTDTSAPPPYSEPDEDEFFHPHREDSDHEHAIREHDRPQGRAPNFGPFRRGLGWRGREGATRRGGRRVRIAMPDHDGTTSPHEDDSTAIDTPSRELTVEEMRQIILDLPTRLKTVLGIDQERSEHDDVDIAEVSESSAVTRKSGQKDQHLDILTKDSIARLAHEERHAGSGWKRGILRNAPIRAPYHTDSTVLDRDEHRWPPPEDDGEDSGYNQRNNQRHTYPHNRSLRSERSPTDIDEDRDPYDAPDVTIPGRAETIIPPTVGDINELSQVYNKVIRDLDREHRRQLHNRDKEMDTLRILLHEKDIVYRQQLKGKDFIIEDIKRRLDHFEETMELQLERARNDVEDLWETRWKEHQTQLMEKIALMKPGLQMYSTSTTQTIEDECRDGESRADDEAT